jgi:hypothetical protein
MVLSHAVTATALTLLVNPAVLKGRAMQPYVEIWRSENSMWKSFALEPYGKWSEFADECIDPKPTLKGSNGLIADC